MSDVIEHPDVRAAVEPVMDQLWYYQRMYEEERDRHTARVQALTELREEVSLAIEDLQNQKPAVAIDRLRRARTLNYGKAAQYS